MLRSTRAEPCARSSSWPTRACPPLSQTPRNPRRKFAREGHVCFEMLFYERRNPPPLLMRDRLPSQTFFPRSDSSTSSSKCYKIRKFRTRAREIEGAPGRTQPGASGIAPPQSRIVPRGQTDVVILFFFFVILTDKTDAGRRDRDYLLLCCTFQYLRTRASETLQIFTFGTN